MRFLKVVVLSLTHWGVGVFLSELEAPASTHLLSLENPLQHPLMKLVRSGNPNIFLVVMPIRLQNVISGTPISRNEISGSAALSAPLGIWKSQTTTTTTTISFFFTCLFVSHFVALWLLIVLLSAFVFVR